MGVSSSLRPIWYSHTQRAYCRSVIQIGKHYSASILSWCHLLSPPYIYYVHYFISGENRDMPPAKWKLYFQIWNLCFGWVTGERAQHSIHEMRELNEGYAINWKIKFYNHHHPKTKLPIFFTKQPKTKWCLCTCTPPMKAEAQIIILSFKNNV